MKDANVYQMNTDDTNFVINYIFFSFILLAYIYPPTFFIEVETLTPQFFPRGYVLQEETQMQVILSQRHL